MHCHVVGSVELMQYGIPEPSGAVRGTPWIAEPLAFGSFFDRLMQDLELGIGAREVDLDPVVL